MSKGFTQRVSVLESNVCEKSAYVSKLYPDDLGVGLRLFAEASFVTMVRAPVRCLFSFDPRTQSCC